MFEQLGSFISDREVVRHIVFTLVLVVGLVVLRSLTLRALRVRGVAPRDYRRWVASTRNSLLFISVLAIGVIWAAELRAVALSLVAVAAALVLATKELILCVSGAFVRTLSGAFEIGDRIEIGGYRGDVLDTNLFTTTVLEIGPKTWTQQQTGRAVVIPNAMFLTGPVINETFTRAFVLHTFTVPSEKGPRWREAEAQLTKLAQQHCAPFLEEAKAHFSRMSREHGMETPTVEPVITLQFDDEDKFSFVVRIPAPVRRKGRIEQEILRGFLEHAWGNGTAAPPGA